MAVVPVIDSVTTTDATPTVAKHVVSKVAGEDVATLAFHFTTAGEAIGAFLILVARTISSVIGNRADFTNGKPVAYRGAVCGMPNAMCGQVAPSSMTPGTVRNVQLSSALLPSVDGDYPVNIYGRADTEGWG